MDQKESLDAVGDEDELENALYLQSQISAHDQNIIFLQALPNCPVGVNEAATQGKQRYQLIHAIPIPTEPASLILEDSEPSTIPMKLEIEFEKRLPSGNVQAKTWVPEIDKSDVSLHSFIRKRLRGLSSRSLYAEIPLEEVKKTKCHNTRAETKVEATVKSATLAQDNSKAALATRIKSFIKIHDKPAQPRAYAVLPDELQYQRGLVSPRRAMPACVRFGPVQGIIEPVTSSDAQELISLLAGKPVFLCTCDDDNSLIHINNADQDKSNWMGLLPLGDERTANVWIHEFDNELYGLTLEPIPASTPLRFGYSKEYAEKYKIEGPTVDILQELSKVHPSHSCKECSRMFARKRQLEAHHAKYHARQPPGRGPYRCRLCPMRFTRKFALKRHQSLTCTRTKENTSIKISAPKPQKPETQSGGFAQQNGADDSNRLPSDESLQNYTNILDISTNLFDTDRMPNLDISGSVKSDNEFNPLGFKEDSHLANDFSFANGLMDDLVVRDTLDAKKSPRKVRSSSPFSCPYCKISMPRSKLKQHSKGCTAKRFECVCGRKYRAKWKMEAHIRECDGVKDSEVLENPYACAECKLTFKRRGMYVNHLTTRHPEATAVLDPPLMVKDRRYPCPSCNKFYKTQAKRHTHVLSQHPGISYDHRQAVVCGSKSVQPAKCWACPRQYVTRAKLLQHARARHPGSEPPASYASSPKKKRSLPTKTT